MSQPVRILLALVAGLVAGAMLAALAPGAVGGTVAVAEPIGTAWLNALQMTIIPLVVSLLISGVAAAAEAARAGAVAGRAIAIIMGVMAASSVAAAVLTPLLLDLAPIPQASAAALRAGLGATEVAPPPPLADFFRSIVPTNAVAAAANGAFISLLVFTLAFAFALTRIEPAGRRVLTAVFEALRDTMLVIVNWLIRIAPVGVFALTLVVAARTGTAAVGALVHYMAVVSAVGVAILAVGYPLAALGGRVPVGRFAREALPAQGIAVSTQSSLATLPAMLKGAEAMGASPATAGVVLPLAVVMMRATGPGMNLAVAIYVARWFGIEIGAATMAAAVVVATLTSLGSVSLPGQVSFLGAITPITATFGAPVAPLGLLVAVETIPDMVRTLGNVTMDLAVTLVVAARGGAVEDTESVPAAEVQR